MNIVLSETKTRGSPSLQSYTAIDNSKYNHGVVAVLFKSWLYDKVSMINVEDEGVVAFELSCVPGIRFCGVYNEPTNSPYFRHSTFAAISAHVSSGKQCVFLGDLNARFGHLTHELVETNNGLSYHVVDNIVNENGRRLTRICKENCLLPVNHLTSQTGSKPERGADRRR